MAIQITLARNDVPYGVALPTAYVRIAMVQVDYQHRTMLIQAAVWADAESRESNLQPIVHLPPVQITDQPQPAQFRVLQDPETGQNLLDENGNPRFIQIAPALPSFAEVEQAIASAASDGSDYRKVGYELLKKLDVIKNNAPMDLI